MPFTLHPLHAPARRPLALLLAAAWPALSPAAEITLDTVAVSGSRVEHNTFDLPAALDVVSGNGLSRDQAGVNASEALAGVPGIVVLNRQNYAQDLQISSRGYGARSAFGVRGIRLIADGIPASMPDGQGQAASFNLDRAERIEVLRGPLSAIYGNHAGGVIQVFTPDGRGAPSVETGVAAGSYASWKTDFAAQGEAGGIGYLLDASRFDTDGFRYHSSARRDQQLGKFTFQPSADGKLTLTASGFQQKADDPLGQTWAGVQTDPRSVATAANQFNTRKTIDQTQGGLSYEHRFGEHSLLVSAYTGRRSTIQYQSIPVGVQANPRHSGGVIDFDRDYSGLTGRWTGRFNLAGGKLTTTAGVDYEQSRDNRRGYENFVGATLGVKGALRRQETDSVSSFDQYAQAEWQGQDWTFSGGLRHSRIAFKVSDAYLSNGDDSGRVEYSKTTPTIAALYRLSPLTNFYASAARGFEAPTFNELFYSGTGGTFSYALKPATSRHLETGLKHFLSEQHRLDLALYQINTSDELVVDSSTGGRSSFRNVGQTLRRGVELALDSRWTPALQSRVALTVLQATYDQGFTTTAGSTVQAGNRLPGIADRNLYAELLWRHPSNGFHAGIEALARSKVQVEDTNQAQAAPGYAIANLRAGYEKRYGPLTLRAFARLDNVFDRNYIGSVVVGDSNGRYYEAAPGRNWLLGLNARYNF
ncbi:MAG: hypothetical protein RIR00_2388 [Pseudomonadota bacterium]|jgi:iron complex outermembrane receptor protein